MLPGKTTIAKSTWTPLRAVADGFDAVLLDHRVRQQLVAHGLEPLTRAEVAAALGVHESTVSRATANKYVQIPNREIVPFSHFFTASLSVKDVIHELIANEATALTDQDIVEILKGRGIEVARRTVTKYRGQLGILPSTLR